eukprot:CAMPEP_0204354984 /NCGR_PEP_ID=MMETSP0469-20131031/33800_1 /ASSEMBLY_ACC=CAM_ASM_000384 /TAXON_ID=2969 /ORGANISM="Oxyrrhis marina" /LENGTH=497 /DNA_ID=CAMNT_0051342171 /DNA_START=16 /DNA_END=1508 /DNA_ORIENTATION=+
MTLAECSREELFEQLAEALAENRQLKKERDALRQQLSKRGNAPDAADSEGSASSAGSARRAKSPEGGVEAATYTIIVEGAIAPRLVGKRGATARQIEEHSGATVQITRPGQIHGGSLVRIRGQMEQKRVALAEVVGLLRNRTLDEKEQIVGLYVPQESVPAVIGSKGTVINAIQAESGCNIDIPREVPGTVWIKGRTEAIAAAIELVYQQVGEATVQDPRYLPNAPGRAAVARERSPPRRRSRSRSRDSRQPRRGITTLRAVNAGGGETTEWKLLVPAETAAQIVGAGGSNVRYLQDRTGARVNVAKEASRMSREDKEVSLSGSRASKDVALERLIDLVLTSTRSQTMKLVVPGMASAFIIGQRGARINDISSKSRARVDVHRDPVGDDCRIVTIEGCVRSVADAALLIFDSVDHASSTMAGSGWVLRRPVNFSTGGAVFSLSLDVAIRIRGGGPAPVRRELWMQTLGACDAERCPGPHASVAVLPLWAGAGVARVG